MTGMIEDGVGNFISVPHPINGLDCYIVVLKLADDTAQILASKTDTSLDRFGGGIYAVLSVCVGGPSTDFIVGYVHKVRDNITVAFTTQLRNDPISLCGIAG